MDLVEEKLWIGGLSAALDTKLLQDHGITHVVTVDIKPLPPNGSLVYLFIPAHDVSSQDLLTAFDSVFEFVETAKKSGSVLVHCYHGVSRSATLITSYLQKKYHISTDESLVRLQAVRPSVQPNDGFMSQLRLYGMLLELDKMDSIVMRWYILQSGINKSSVEYWNSLPSPSGASSQSTLKCRTCRYVLSGGSEILQHRPGQNPDWKDLSWVQFALSPQAKANLCRLAYFVIPPAWMAENHAPQGKLLCPKCQSKLGAFNWNQSLRCPCAASFQPAFYFTPSRVDYT